MPPRSIFSLRVVRCPACHARLPVRGSEAMVVCEYCDARVELLRRRQPPRPASPTGSGPRHTARPTYSALAAVLALAVLLVGVAAAVTLFASPGPDVLGLLEPASPEPPSSPPSHPATESAPPPSPKGATAQIPRRPTPRTGGDDGNDDPRPKKDRPKTKPSGSASGPVLSVADAKARLEPDVLACMRKAKTHSLRAYLGNKTVGPVSLLRDSRTRVDGLRAKLIGTNLGRCIDRAGASVRTRAFKSNYVRLELRNEDVPDPLAGLPARADREAIARTIEARDAQVHACAAKHGEQGAREVFYFQIDGPTGKVLSVRGAYGSRAFRRCAEPIYRKLVFDRVQQREVKHTHHVQL